MGGKGCGRNGKGTAGRSLGSPGRSGTGRGRPHCSPSPEGSARLRALGAGLLGPSTRPSGRQSGRPKPDPGNSARLGSYHGEDGGGIHPRFPFHWGWGQGKGSTGRSGPAAPLSGAATALPLGKMAALSHVSNRKWRGSKGGRRGAVGWGMCRYPAAGQVCAKEVRGLALQRWNLMFLPFH